MRSITLLSPAKINLTLEVLGVRADGYHEIRSIIQPIDLFDELSIEVDEGAGIEIESSGIELPSGQENLAWKAAELFLTSSNLKKKIRISIRKRIPLGAGLGGGSSNAAAVLTGLNRLTEALSQDELFGIAPKIGADVPFFIRSLASNMEGIGEKITAIKDFPTFHYVILCPNIHTSTKEVYKKWDELKSSDKKQAENSRSDINEVIKQFHDETSLPPLYNDLEDPAIALHPEIDAYKKILSSLGLKSVLMTGSGSAVYAIFRNIDDAYEIYEYLQTSPTFQVFFASGIKGWHRVI